MADITFLIAGIGGGKSLLGTRFCLEEFSKSDRMIVTNIPLRLVRFDDSHLTIAEWCHLYVKDPIDVLSRLYVLEHEQVKEFYRYYPQPVVGGVSTSGLGKPWVLPMLDADGSRDKDGRLRIPNLQARLELQKSGSMARGCFFIIDEVHLYFAAREWSEHGLGIESYMSQLRKLNDDLLLITQHPEKVDKNFRRNATEWLYVKNFSRTKLVGGVTLKNRFKYQTYPQMPVRGDKPTSGGWFSLKDRQYHKCYDTMAGVGLTGGMQAEGSRIKGRHWSIYLSVLLVPVVAWFAVKGLLRGAGMGFHHALGAFGGPAFVQGSSGGIAASVGGKMIHPLGGPAVALSSNNTSPLPAESGSPGHVVVDKPKSVLSSDFISFVWSQDTFVDSIQVVGGIPTVWLTDGTRWSVGDGHFMLWKEGVALIDGVYYRSLSFAERSRFEERRYLNKSVDVARHNGTIQ